ncbi:hypothetical protein LLH23_15795 [bacterium]|nr:hypothetical protein [bacterium]
MNHKTEDGADAGRRAFVRTTVRWTAALALGGGLAALTRGSRQCAQPCASCPDWAACRKSEREPLAQGPGK